MWSQKGRQTESWRHVPYLILCDDPIGLHRLLPLQKDHIVQWGEGQWLWGNATRNWKRKHNINILRTRSLLHRGPYGKEVITDIWFPTLKTGKSNWGPEDLGSVCLRGRLHVCLCVHLSLIERCRCYSSCRFLQLTSSADCLAVCLALRLWLRWVKSRALPCGWQLNLLYPLSLSTTALRGAEDNSRSVMAGPNREMGIQTRNPNGSETLSETGTCFDMGITSSQWIE